ncbi:MAG TPA: SAF domain-containing protein [Acidimicrobiales bacterium]|nr:SAF domain-containing protein [Acidimicrobiales bacterium]
MEWPPTATSGGRRGAGRPAGIPYVRRRERNTRWVAFGLLLTTLGGLGAFVVATRLADRVDVVVAARPIDAGRPLTADDLTTVAIAGGDGARAPAPSLELWISNDANLSRDFRDLLTRASTSGVEVRVNGVPWQR